MTDERFPSRARLPTNKVSRANLRPLSWQPRVSIFVLPVYGLEPKFSLLKVACWNAKKLNSLGLAFGIVAASHDTAIVTI